LVGVVVGGVLGGGGGIMQEKKIYIGILETNEMGPVRRVKSRRVRTRKNTSQSRKVKHILGGDFRKKTDYAWGGGDVNLQTRSHMPSPAAGEKDKNKITQDKPWG